MKIKFADGTWEPQAHYRYDAEGRRFNKRYYGVIADWEYMGWINVDFQYLDNDVISEQYLYEGRSETRHLDYFVGDEIDETYGYRDVSTAESRFYLKDQFNSVMALLNDSGEAMEFYTYGPYGEVEVRWPDGTVDTWGTKGNLNNARFFQSRELDPESGLYYFRARYYKPSLGRFISIDPIEFDELHNQYTFVHNNPATLNDPLGEMAHKPKFKDCSKERKKVLTEDDSVAAKMTKTTREHTNKRSKIYKKCEKAGFKKFFGCQDKKLKDRHQWRHVRGVFRRMNREFQKRKRTYKCTERDATATAMPGFHIRIHKNYWRRSAQQWWKINPQVRRATTLVHETAHKKLCGGAPSKEVYAGDEIQGLYDLAKNNPKRARRNADSHAWFAVERHFYPDKKIRDSMEANWAEDNSTFAGHLR